MSMTYPTREPASAIDTQDAVFVPATPAPRDPAESR